MLPAEIRPVVPPVVEEQLPAARLEPAQVRVDGIHRVAHLLDGERQIAFEIETLGVPGRVVCAICIVRRESVSAVPLTMRPQADSLPGTLPAKTLFAVRSRHGCIGALHCRELRGRQARIGLGARDTGAWRRRTRTRADFEEAVLDAVAAITRGEHRACQIASALRLGRRRPDPSAVGTETASRDTPRRL